MILAVVLPGIEERAGAVDRKNLLSLLGFQDSSDSDEPISTGVVPVDSSYTSLTSLTNLNATYTTRSTTSTFATENLRSSEIVSAVSKTNPLGATTSFSTIPDLSSPTTLPTAYAAGEASDHTDKTWQIFGIVIIAILFVVACLTSAMFFDRIWRFVRATICHKTQPDVMEEFVPDWEKRSWETEMSSSTKGIPTSNSFTTVEAWPRELPWDTENPRQIPLHRQPTQTGSRTVAV